VITCEQQARNMLERMEIKDAQNMTSGDVVELANLIRDAELSRQIISKVEKYIIQANNNAESLHDENGELVDYEEMIETANLIQLIKGML